MERWTTLGGLAAILTAVLLATFVFTGPKPVSTQDIDIFDRHMNGSLHPATFVPGVPREVVVQQARGECRKGARRQGRFGPGNQGHGGPVYLEERGRKLGGGEEGVAGGRGRLADNLPLRPGRNRPQRLEATQPVGHFL